METKICTKCGKELPYTTEFFNPCGYVAKRTGIERLEARCIKCRQAKSMEIIKRHLDNPAERAEILRKRKEQARRHYIENLEYYKARNDRYSKIRSERQKERRRNGEFKESDKIRTQKRWANPKYKVSKTMSNRINSLLKKRGASWLCYVDYSLQDLISHLEKQFTPEMNWQNHGPYWHIDHIKPVDSFNFTSFDCEDFKKCWALENLRPLEAIKNIQKGAKLDYIC